MAGPSNGRDCKWAWPCKGAGATMTGNFVATFGSKLPKLRANFVATFGPNLPKLRAICVATFLPLLSVARDQYFDNGTETGLPTALLMPGRGASGA